MTGCTRCVKAVERGTGHKWEVGIKKYNDPKEDAYTKLVDDCCAELDKIDALPNDQQPRFEPPNSVEVHSHIGQYSYYELGFLSDAQVPKYTGLSIKGLGMDPSVRRAEDGKTVIEGLYISLADLPDSMSFGELLSLRKVRLFNQSSTCLLEHQLLAEHQLHEKQGIHLLPFLEDLKPKDSALKPSTSVPTLVELIDLAQPILQKQKAKEEALAAKMAGHQDGESDVEEVPAKKGRVAVGAAAMVPLSKKDLQKMAAEKKRALKARQASPPPRRDSSKRSDSPTSAVSRPKSSVVGKEGNLKEEDIRAKIGHDTEMLMVCLRIESVPVCLLNLTVENSFTSSSIGNQIHHADPSAVTLTD